MGGSRQAVNCGDLWDSGEYFICNQSYRWSSVPV